MKNIFLKSRIFKTIVAAMTIAVAVFAFVACAEDDTVEKTFEEQWMSYISDEVLVSEVVMPGCGKGICNSAQRYRDTAQGGRQIFRFSCNDKHLYGRFVLFYSRKQQSYRFRWCGFLRSIGRIELDSYQ